MSGGGWVYMCYGGGVVGVMVDINGKAMSSHPSES